jgi:hypothetical protein
MRIFSWDTKTGGSRPYFANIFQYKVGTKIFSKVAYNKSYLKDGAYEYLTEPKIFPFYSQLHALKTTDKTYYLGINNTISSGKYASQSIKILTIDGNNLNDSIALIKTKNGLVNEIEFSFNFFNLSDRPERPFQLIKYDSERKIISIPTLDNDGNLSDNFILYKFTGNYFELLETPENKNINEVGIGFVAQRNSEFTAHPINTVFRDSKLTKKWKSIWAQPLIRQPKSDIYYFVCLEKTDNYYKILVNKNEIACVPTAEITESWRRNRDIKIVGQTFDGSYDFKTWESVLSEAVVRRLTKDNPIIKNLNGQPQIIENNCGWDNFYVNEVYRAKNGEYWLNIRFSSECEDRPGLETKMEQGWIKWREGNKLLITISFEYLQC